MVNLLKETSFNNFVYKKYEGTTIEEQKKRYERLDQGKNEKEIEKRAPVDVPIYFYHPDHLGTTNALTDVNGNMYQFFLNLPFGETMAEQTSISYYQTEFKFNGKELDSETGMYYYGARYYDPSLSIWMSVDPLAEQFPNFSPYNYTMNNPINMIDPDGRAPEVSEDWRDKNGNLIWDKSLNDGKGDFTEHATGTDKNLAKALRQTDTGEEIFQHVINSETDYQVELDIESEVEYNEGGVPKAGRTVDIKYATESDLTTGETSVHSVQSAKIIICQKAIEKIMFLYKDGYNIPASDIDETSTFNGLNFSEIVGVVFGHEVQHGTKENIALLLGKDGKTKSENAAQEISDQIIKELKNND